LGETGYPISTKDPPGMQQYVATQDGPRLDNSLFEAWIDTFSHL
jgi:hypothetical protein